jgi:N-methylhydantoinase B
VFPGAGEFRGGLGVVKSQRFLVPGFMTHESDRNEDVPWGIFGGGEGVTAAVRMHNHTEDTPPIDVPAKISGLRAEAGDVITYLSPGGGGYGPSLKRDPNKVLDDLLDGYITPDHARDVYGVVVKPVTNGYQWGLDLPATAKLRASLTMA